MKIAHGPAWVMFLTSVALAADRMKVPEACIAAPRAQISHEGYAGRVIHRKSGVELLLVPAGSHTKQEVTFARPFYVGTTEVTNAQYKKFIEQSGYDGIPDVDPAYDVYLRHLRGKSIMPQGDDFPVVYVSWRNARAYCAWAGDLDLPSESEWEYACRAGTATHYSFGNNPVQYKEYGWGNRNSGANPHPVAQLKPNAWGLYDMHGNVWEWCLDDFVRDAAPPPDGSARDADRITKVLRSGSWSTATQTDKGGLKYPALAESRFSSAATNATNDTGFRVVLRLKPPPPPDSPMK